MCEWMVRACTEWSSRGPARSARSTSSAVDSSRAPFPVFRRHPNTEARERFGHTPPAFAQHRFSPAQHRFEPSFCLLSPSFQPPLIAIGRAQILLSVIPPALLLARGRLSQSCYVWHRPRRTPSPACPPRESPGLQLHCQEKVRRSSTGLHPRRERERERESARGMRVSPRLRDSNAHTQSKHGRAREKRAPGQRPRHPPWIPA